MSDNLFANDPGTQAQEPQEQTAQQQAPQEPETRTEPKQDPKPEFSQEPRPDPYVELLKEIKSDDGRQKYATVSDALTSLQHAQAHISKLEQENAQLREKSQEAESLEALVEKLQPTRKDDNPTEAVNEQQIMDIVEQTITQKERQATARQNTQQVVQAMKDQFGDQAESTFYGKAEELGITNEFLNDMAARSPKAVLALFGESKKQEAPRRFESDFSSPPTQQKEEVDFNIMAGASSDKILKAWNACRPKQD